MKISIIGTVGIPAKYGGFETLVEYLTKHLHNDFDITVFCSSKAYSEKLETYNGVKLSYIPLDANGIQSIPYDIISILKSLKFADTILILGVSGCIVLPFVKLFSSKKIIVNIDGLEWKRHKWKKYAQVFLRFSEKWAVTYADVIVSDNKVIQEYVDLQYDKKSTLIAYGADHVRKLPMSKEVLDRFPFLNKEYAFTVCRIEPENNLHLILEGFAQEKNLNLVIVGNWNASQYGIELKEKFSKYSHIYLLDPIYDQNILDQIRSNCKIYIHGHSAGGTNPSLIEAMYLGLPVFAYDVPYNVETTHYEAKYFKDADELIFLLRNLKKWDLNKISNNMEEIAKNIYTWNIVAKKYSEIF